MNYLFCRTVIKMDGLVNKLNITICMYLLNKANTIFNSKETKIYKTSPSLKKIN